MTERRILLVNYDFPPGLSGVRRVVKFAKFLPEFGFQPIVLAARPDERMPLDYDALAEVEAQGYPVYRTASFDAYQIWRWLRFGRGSQPSSAVSAGSPSRLARVLRSASRFVLMPDDRVGWVPFAKRAAARIVHEHKPQIVLTSSYPNSAHLVGLDIKRRFGLPWVADFRDSWTTNPYVPAGPTRLHERCSAAMERSVVQRADAVVTVSEPIAAHLRSLAGANAHKVHVIPNGFDDDDLRGVEPVRFAKFTLAYTGTLFPPRSPEPLFRALQMFRNRVPDIASKLGVVFMTRMRPEAWQLAEEPGVADMVENRGLGTHRAAVGLQLGADVLLAIEAPTANVDTMLTQKVFEYLAARKPILAITPEGALAELVRHTGAGVVVAPTAPEAIASAVQQLFERSAKLERNEEAIARYHRRELTRELARVLNAIVGGNA